VQVYNAIAPLLLELRDQQEAATTRVRRAWVASLVVGSVAVLVGYLV
jgi:hypothetical protein